MRNLHQAGHTDYYLLGDSGYPLRTWLLTPLDIHTVPNTPEHKYNLAHKNTRCKIECCNGLLKAKFRCLLKQRTLHYSPSFACKIINACVVLHNMCIEYRVPDPEPEGDDNIDFGIIDENVIQEEDIALRRVNFELYEGRRARHRVIQNFRN